MPDRSRRRITPAEQFRRLWGGGPPPPDLDAFLATVPGIAPDDLLDVIETDRAERWRRGDRVKAERYLKDYPALKDDPEAALVVIYGEYYLRKETGETPSLMEYIARFPHHARRLRDQVMWHEAIELGPTIGGPAGAPEVPGLTMGPLLGRGGMCSVYRATDIATGEDVAVKVLDPEHLHHPQRVARFRREVGSLLRLTHPNIVRAIRTGEAGGVLFLVMEYCTGGTLSAHLAGRPLPPETAADVLRTLADAVQHAHDQGVIHRDLKPGNILLAGDRGQETGDRGLGTEDRGQSPVSCLLSPDSCPLTPKVSDFGLAKTESGASGAITASRETLGTPCYMAPELTTGAADADTRTDVYGLGAILYELLTGRPPFVATTPLEVVGLVREEPPVPPSRLNPEVPAALEAVCLRCLEKEPERRYQTAAAVREQIHQP